MTVTLICTGFSIVSAFILYLAYVFFLYNLNKSWIALSSGGVLIFSLAALQLLHIEFALQQTDLFTLPWYRFWLTLVPPMFFLFSRAILTPGAKNRAWLLLHLLPLLINFIQRYEIAIVAIFLVGCGYTVWFANLIWNFRAQRARFKYEMFFFGFFALLALLVLGFGVMVPYIDNQLFYYFYANSIALSFILIVSAFIVFPELLNEIAAVASISYSTSTLNDVDIQQSLHKLESLMNVDKLYQNEKLKLSTVAAAMGLSSHQLSELINVHYGKSFSRYIREQRVTAAKHLLATQNQASILAISMETGFSSQSNFYAAFKEITGQSPGDYRKSLSR